MWKWWVTKARRGDDSKQEDLCSEIEDRSQSDD